MILTLAALCALAQTPRAIVRGTGPLACPAVGVAMEREREWP
jgi:hypothetical protein